MRPLRSLLAVAASLALATPALASSIPRDPSHELVVALAAAPAGTGLTLVRARFAERAAALGLTVAATLADAVEPGTAAATAPHPFDLDPARVLLLRAPDAARARAAAERLAGDPSIEWFEPNQPREACAFPLDGTLPDDPLLRSTRQWGLWNAGPAGAFRGLAGADIGARAAWVRSCGGNQLVLAVADTGVDPGHPDLQRLMPDGTPRLGNGRSVTLDGNRSWADSNAHGTAVAGVMAALTHDGTHFDSLGIAGVCGGDGGANAGCRLVPIRISGYQGVSSTFEIASGIVYAVSAGARVLNVSFAGGGDTGLERRALWYAMARGCVVVAAAGNRGLTAPVSPQYPAAYAADGLCIQAGASDAWDRRAAFSSYGPGLDLLAPGLDVWTTAPTYANAVGARWPGYLLGSGTSFAAPHVAGAAGLLLARRPELADRDLQHVLRESARDIGAPGVDAETGWGRLDADAALRAVGPDIGIWHDEFAAIARPTGLFGNLTVAVDSVGTFDRGPWWNGRTAERVDVSITVVLPDSFAADAHVWPRTCGTLALRDGFRFPYFAPWAEVAARDGRTVTLRGSLYRLPGAAVAARAAGAMWALPRAAAGARLAGTEEPDPADAWLPLPPDQARIAFTVLGVVDRTPRLAVPAAVPGTAAMRATPNPVVRGTRLVGPAGSRIMLCDLAGRVIRRVALDPVSGAFEWDARDSSGRRVRPGIYFARLDGGPLRAPDRPAPPLRLVVLE